MSGTLDKSIARAEGFLKRFREKPGRPPDRWQAGQRQRRDLRDALANRQFGDRARSRAVALRRSTRPRRPPPRPSAPAGRSTTGDERRKLLHKIADAIEARADEIALDRVDRYRPADPLHVEGGRARRGEFPLLRRPRAGRERRPVAADRHASQLHDPPADRSRGRDHALEHAVHAVHLEDRARARGRLHGGAQAGRVEPAHRDVALRDLPRSRTATGRAQHGARLRRGCRPRADRASRHQGGRLRRRERDRLRHHGAGRRDAEACAFRARRQEPGHRVRRRRPRPCARCGAVHDLLAQRRALHVVEPRAGRSLDL